MRNFLLALALLLAACQDSSRPTPTADESARLDEADAMLDNAAANEVR